MGVPYAEEIPDFKLEFPVNVWALRLFPKIFRIDHDIDRFRLIVPSQKSRERSLENPLPSILNHLKKSS
jgi:hypothetical protein